MITNQASTDDKMIQFYTDFPNHQTYKIFNKYVEPAKIKNMQSTYYQAADNTTLEGRPRNMLLIDELFLFLCRLWLGILEQDLAEQFKCSTATVSRGIITWANFLYFVLGSLPFWLTMSNSETEWPIVLRRNILTPL